MKQRIFRIIALMATVLVNGAMAQKTTVILNEYEAKDVISKHIYGHFSEHLGACIYNGLWVGENSSIPNTNGVRNDFIEAMKEIKAPNLRWPGGCFADEYHWKDGIGPKESRPSIVNTHWGGVTEDNSFGTHEFLNMCEVIGTEPYVCANVGSSTIREIAEWDEYMTHDGKSPMADLRRKNGRDKPWKVKFFGIGNETWGCGGSMTPEHYSDVLRQYSTYAKNYSGNQLYKIGVGANRTDYNWTEVVMKNAQGSIQGLSLHCYTGSPSIATDFNDAQYYDHLRVGYEIDVIIQKHSTIMDKYDPNKRVGLMVDEWGAWHRVEKGTNPGFLYQQNTLRDALLAAMTLNIFNNHCDRVRMSNIAQLVNVLQALFLTKDEKFLKTPTFYIYNMYKVHQDAKLIPSNVTTGNVVNGLPQVTVSASKDADGLVHVSFVNVDLEKAAEIECIINSDNSYSADGGEIVTSAKAQDCNTFEVPNTITEKSFNDYKIKGNRVSIKVPAKSAVTICLK